MATIIFQENGLPSPHIVLLVYILKDKTVQSFFQNKTFSRSKLKAREKNDTFTPTIQTFHAFICERGYPIDCMYQSFNLDGVTENHVSVFGRASYSQRSSFVSKRSTIDRRAK